MASNNMEHNWRCGDSGKYIREIVDSMQNVRSVFEFVCDLGLANYVTTRQRRLLFFVGKLS